MTRYFAMSPPTPAAANWGTPGTRNQYMEIIAETLSQNNNLIFDEDVSNRSPRTQNAGPFEVAGDVTLHPRPDNIGYWLAAILSPSLSTPTSCTNTRQHRFKQAETLNHFSGETVIDNPEAIGTIAYDGLMVDTMAFSHDPEGRLEMVASLMGRSADISGSAGTPTFSTLNPYVFHMGVVSIAGVQNNSVEAMSWSIVQNLQKVPVTNSRFPARYKPGGLVIEGTIDISFEDLTHFKQFLGAAAATTPASDIDAIQLEIAYTEFTAIESSPCAADQYYKLAFDFPSIVFNTNAANINAQERVIQNLSWRALYDATNASAIVVDVVNLDIADYVDA